MDVMELWVNGEYYCDLDFEEGYYKIPSESARWLNLFEGDVLEVKRVWHEQ